MDFKKATYEDLEYYVYNILGSTKKNFREGKLLWLEGFDGIIQDQILLEQKFEQSSSYSGSKSSRTMGAIYPSFYQKHKKRIDDEILTPVYLNLDSDYHLAFWIENFSSEDDDFCKIFYSTESYGMVYDKPRPLMELRVNQFFSSNESIPLQIEYNGRKVNTYDAFDEKINPQLLIDAYLQIGRIVSDSAVLTKSSRKKSES